MITIDFGTWSLRDFAANTFTGGGLNFSSTRLVKSEGETVFEMFDRKNTGYRVKFVEVLEDAAAGNIYRISVRVKLGEACSVDSTEVVVGVTDPFALLPVFFCEPQNVTKNEWRKIEFTYTVTDDSHTSISVEQKENGIPIAESIVIGGIETELLFKAEKKRETDGRKTLWLIGDSITCNYSPSVVTKGWGMYIGEHLDETRIKVCNMAKAGLSTKSFINTDGFAIWTYVCKKMRKGDCLIVSLGINDFGSSLPERRTTKEEYRENLCAFADEAHRLGVTLLFVTSTVTVEHNPVENYRRGFLETMICVAKEKRELGYDVSCVDLNAYMLDEIRKIEGNEGYEYLVNSFFAYSKKPDGTVKRDTTHHIEAGSRWVASMIAELVKNSDSPIRNFLK